MTMPLVIGLIVTGVVGIGLCVAIYLVRCHSQVAARCHREAALDAALEDSFPASDPPSHSTFTTVGGPQ